jgi:hypothetical protein
MLQAVAPSSYSLRTSLLKTESEMADLASRDDLSHGSDEEDDGKVGRSKSRRELPAGAVATLKAWLLSPEHFTHPYPTPQDQVMLMQKTGIDKKQLKNWFTNARRRIWKPMLKKQLEQGKLTATGAVPGVMPGLMVQHMPGGMPGLPQDNSGMNLQYQRAVQQQQMGHQPQDQQQVRYDNVLPPGDFFPFLKSNLLRVLWPGSTRCVWKPNVHAARCSSFSCLLATAAILRTASAFTWPNDFEWIDRFLSSNDSHGLGAAVE